MLSQVFERTRTLRGAVCGAVAATVWAVQQPLDKRVLGSRYDDVELLGKAFTRGDGWYALGLAIHVQNGAAFGAVYANLAPALPIAPVLRGPCVALAEHLVSWPLGAVSDRIHPARDEMPTLWRNRRAFTQSLWRHLLFGLILGELERRLNAEPEPTPPPETADYANNGHGRLEQTVNVTSYDRAD